MPSGMNKTKAKLFAHNASFTELKLTYSQKIIVTGANVWSKDFRKSHIRPFDTFLEKNLCDQIFIYALFTEKNYM
jgi:hypothetical protein